MSTTQQITYLRTGRTKRGSGEIIETHQKTGMFKVKPARKEWKTIWITVTELQMGGDSPPKPSPHHIGAVNKMIEGLKELLDRKENAA